MKEFRLVFLFLIAALLLIPSLALAHHSAAAYESTKQIVSSGVATEFHFVNPHVLIYWTAKDEEGNVQKWQGELTSPNHLIRSGWNKEIIKAGDALGVDGTAVVR